MAETGPPSTLLRRATIAGALSGASSSLYALTHVELKEQDVTIWFFDNRFLFVGPLSMPIALFFAAALWWLISAVERVSIPSVIWLTCCSLFAWYIAPRMTVPMIQVLEDAKSLPDEVKRFVFGIPGGATGALCIVGSAAVLLKPLRSPAPILCVTGTGALASLAIGFPGDGALSIAPLFFAWQIGVLVVMALFLRERRVVLPRR